MRDMRDRTIFSDCYHKPGMRPCMRDMRDRTITTSPPAWSRRRTHGRARHAPVIDLS